MQQGGSLTIGSLTELKSFFFPVAGVLGTTNGLSSTSTSLLSASGDSGPTLRSWRGFEL